LKIFATSESGMVSCLERGYCTTFGRLVM
jgi:hypothetical protein